MGWPTERQTYIHTVVSDWFLVRLTVKENMFLFKI